MTGTPGAILRAVLLVAVGVMVLVVVAVGNPRVGQSIAQWISRRGDRHRGRVGTTLGRIGSALDRSVHEYREALRSLQSDWHRPMAASLLLSVVMLLAKCLVGYLLATGMGYAGGYLDVAARQSIQWLLIYFSPSPGGSGLAEATVPAFLAGIVPAGRVVEFTILWRIITGFIGPAVGAFVTLRILGGDRPARPPSTTRAPGA